MNLSAVEFADEIFTNGDRPPPLTGKKIGVYEIVSELGSGGMGTVYLAERRDEKFDQRVAIKILRRELDSPVLRKAFARELANQALLIHPNIAAIIDAGTTEDDRPFIVMELVVGLPIDKYCNEHGLTLHQRLKLFNKVCDAVGFAHRNLIIHRDLKPSNILVTNEGVPKLLDFGISELVDPDKPKESRQRVLALTPAYSSPEQLAGEPVSTPADIYSLGVILLKLIGGSISRRNQNGEHSAAGDTKSFVFPSELRGGRNGTGGGTELESIISKALEEEPDKRYTTTGQLSGDIWRFIDGLPIEVHSSSNAYRLSKFVRRRKLLVLSGVLILVSVIGGVSAALWQASTARAQAVLANSERDRSEKISKFMFRVLSYANPNWYAEGSKSKGQARVLDVMFEMGDKIDEEFANEPDVAAELHYRFSEALLSHQEGKVRGRSHILRALELRKSFYGDWHELVAKDMAYVYWSKPEKSDEDIAKFAEAITMLRGTNPANRNLPFMLEDYGYRLFDDTQSELAEFYYRHAPERASFTRHELADKYFVEMLELLRLHYAENDNPIIFNKCALAMTKAKIGQFDEAETYFNVCKSAIDAMPTKRQNWVERLEIAESLMQQRPGQ